MEGLLPADLVAHGLGKSAGVIFVEDSWALTFVIGEGGWSAQHGAGGDFVDGI